MNKFILRISYSIAAKPRNILIKTQIVLSFFHEKKRSIEYYLYMAPIFIALLWVTRLNQDRFHPLVAFIPL